MTLLKSSIKSVATGARRSPLTIFKVRSEVIFGLFNIEEVQHLYG